MQRVFVIILFMVVGLAEIATTRTVAQDCTHFVAPDGDDAAPGTPDAPWGTIQQATDSTQPGDVVCILPGEYTAEDGIRFSVSGVADQPITFVAPDGATVLGSLEIVPGVSHLRIEGLIVAGFPIWGVTVYGGNQDITLARLEVGGGEAGIHFTYGDSGESPADGPVDGVALIDSVIHDSEYTAVDCTPGPCNNLVFRNLEIYGAGISGEGNFGADGLAVERGQNVLVEDCYIHDNGGDGIDLNSRDAMAEADAGEIVVRGNRVANHLRNGIKLWRGGLAENNLVWNSGEENLVLALGSSYTIVNNTFANRTTYGYLALLGDDSAPGETTAITLVNNLFYNDNPEMGGTLIYVSRGIQLDADYNLYHNPYREEDVICLSDDFCVSADQINDGTWFADTGQGEHSFYADPLFVDAAEGDFRLSEKSPALDAGSPDYAPDIGANLPTMDEPG